MKKIWKEKKLNNKGFSMVEVITAVILLSIVAIPLLNSFITSIRVGARAKEMQRVTAAAESVMEGFKAYHYDELVKQFKGAGKSDIKILNGDKFEAFSISDATTDASLAVSTTNNKGTATVVDTAVFSLKGLDYEGAKYDAMVRVEPFESASSVSHNGTKEYNHFGRMNGYKDGVYTQNLEDVTNSYYALLTQIASKLNEVDKVYGYIGTDPTRGYKPNSLDMNKIKVYRESKVTIQDKKVEVKVTYKAEATGYPYYDNYGYTQLLNYTASPVIEDLVCYDTTAISDAGAELDNLYLFVYPVYKTTDSGYRFEEDKYDISYGGSRDIKLFFIKQYNSTIASDKLVTCENLYPIVGTVRNVALYHNVDTNLGNETMHTGKTSPFSLLGTATNHTSLYEEDDDAMLYKVVVKIFEEGQYDTFSDPPLYTLEGTMSE
ncbi:MAG: type II secretion system GspH family protein [Lachnospiraceae bacterium]|nr:type II secretion system GspH family protein [Lachnospiraceae bacterium]